MLWRYNYDYSDWNSDCDNLRQELAPVGFCDPWALHGAYIGGVLYGTISEVAQSHEQFPIRFSLQQNYPNPFNPSTTISYQLPSALGGQIQVTLKVFDVLGREVAALAQEKKQQGEFSVIWNSDNLPGGVYFYRLEAGDFIQTKKMVLIK